METAKNEQSATLANLRIHYYSFLLAYVLDESRCDITKNLIALAWTPLDSITDQSVERRVVSVAEGNSQWNWQAVNFSSNAREFASIVHIADTQLLRFKDNKVAGFEGLRKRYAEVIGMAAAYFDENKSEKPWPTTRAILTAKDTKDRGDQKKDESNGLEWLERLWSPEREPMCVRIQWGSHVLTIVPEKDSKELSFVATPDGISPSPTGGGK